MDGERFVSHLKALRVPGADTLVGSDYDWLFLTEENSPLSAFLEWFTGNVVSGDIITDEELEEYDAAVSHGDILSSQQLEEMEDCFARLPTGYNSSQEDGHQDKLSSEENERLQSQLEVLTMRKNQLGMHKMELREEVYRAGENVKVAENIFANQLDTLMNTSRQLSEVHSQLAVSLDKLTDIFVNFSEKPDEEAQFIPQLDLTEWHHEEAKFTDTLKAYISKQFREGIKEVAGAGDTSEYCLLDVGHLDLHLVRGAGKTEYAENVNELNRLGVVLRQTEEWRLDGLLLQARRRAEVEEANRLLAAVHRGQLPNALYMLHQQTAEAADSRLLVERERAQQHGVLQSLIAEVAQLESTRTISGNYQLKCKRQEYFLEKQKIVLDQLISQLARHDWIAVALDIENDKIGTILQVLKRINSIVSSKFSCYTNRMECMEELQKEHDKGKAVGQLPPPLVTLMRMLPPVPSSHPVSEGQQEEPVSGEILLKRVKALNSALNVTKEQMSTIRNPQFSGLSKMSTNCEVLEVGLFGNAGSLKPLPVTWLEPQLLEHCMNLDQENWKLKQKVIQFLCQYEEKKKILQIEPSLQAELMNWTTDVLKMIR